ncbi:MAG: N-acetylmuramoyl-L-alanine amidase [Planctomycetota bacterium]
MSRILLLCLLLGIALSAGGADLALEPLLAAGNIKLTRTEYPSRYKLTRGSTTGYFAVGVGQLVIKNTGYPLDEPPVFRNGRLMVSPGFAALVKSKFGKVAEEFWQTVVIDPGHGGKDPGAISPVNGLQEKDVVLDIARTLGKLLETAGVKVFLTRDSDTFIPLEARPATANQHAAQLFVSIHANACESEDVSGVEVFYGADWPEESIDSTSRAYYLAGATDLNCFQTGAGSRAFSPAEETFFFKLMVDESDRAGKAAAQIVVDTLARGLELDNHGIKTKNLRVIRCNACPAILVETGFLTNPAEARNLATEEYRAKAAKLMAEGIKAFLREHARAR